MDGLIDRVRVLLQLYALYQYMSGTHFPGGGKEGVSIYIFSILHSSVVFFTSHLSQTPTSSFSGHTVVSKVHVIPPYVFMSSPGSRLPFFFFHRALG